MIDYFLASGRKNKEKLYEYKRNFRFRGADVCVKVDEVKKALFLWVFCTDSDIILKNVLL